MLFPWMLESQWPHYNYSGNIGLMGLNTGGLINPCEQWWCEFRINNSLRVHQCPQIMNTVLGTHFQNWDWCNINKIYYDYYNHVFVGLHCFTSDIDTSHKNLKQANYFFPKQFNELLAYIIACSHRWPQQSQSESWRRCKIKDWCSWVMTEMNWCHPSSCHPRICHI